MFRQCDKLLCLLAAVLRLAGCATTRRGQPFAQEFEAYGVDPAVEAKVENLSPLELADIEHLTNQGVPDQRIVEYVTRTTAVYYLRDEDIDRLRANHVSETVINFLLSTPGLYVGAAAYPYPYWWYPYSYYGAGFVYFAGHHHVVSRPCVPAHGYHHCGSAPGHHGRH